MAFRFKGIGPVLLPDLERGRRGRENRVEKVPVAPIGRRQCLSLLCDKNLALELTHPWQKSQEKACTVALEKEEVVGSFIPGSAVSQLCWLSA